MNSIDYFKLYDNYFKDANDFLNALEERNNLLDCSSESTLDDYEEIDENNNQNKVYINVYINDESNKVEYRKKGDVKEKNNYAFFPDNNNAFRFFISYGHTYNIFSYYKPYNENINMYERNYSNLNHSFSIFKNKNLVNKTATIKTRNNNLYVVTNEKAKLHKEIRKSKLYQFLTKCFIRSDRNKDKMKLLLPNEKSRKVINIEQNPKSNEKFNLIHESKYAKAINQYNNATNVGQEKGKNKMKNKDKFNERINANGKEGEKKSKLLNIKNDKLFHKKGKGKKSQIISDMIKKKKEEKRGISYAHLLKTNKLEYDAFYLYNPRFKQGKHHTVMQLQSYNVSIIPFVKPKKLKEEVNQLFSELNPWIHKSLTLSKLRNLKIDLFNLLTHVPELDISTVSCAWIFFERLIFKGHVHKYNRKLYAATCLILSLKFYQHDDIQILGKLLTHIKKMDKKENLTPSLIFSVEFYVYSLLDFSLRHTYDNIRPHIHQYLESKELKFEDIYGTSEDLYLNNTNYCFRY